MILMMLHHTFVRKASMASADSFGSQVVLSNTLQLPSVVFMASFWMTACEAFPDRC